MEKVASGLEPEEAHSTRNIMNWSFEEARMRDGANKKIIVNSFPLIKLQLIIKILSRKL
jgi:hypothetical protein